MFKFLSTALLSLVLISGCTTNPSSATAIRIDSSSPNAAQTSYNAMMNARSDAERQRLALAVLMIGLEGTKSAGEAMNSPDPSIISIRDKVAGMTAEEIILRATKNPSVHVEPAGN